MSPSLASVWITDFWAFSELGRKLGREDAPLSIHSLNYGVSGIMLEGWHAVVNVGTVSTLVEFGVPWDFTDRKPWDPETKSWLTGLLLVSEPRAEFCLSCLLAEVGARFPTHTLFHLFLDSSMRL